MKLLYLIPARGGSKGIPHKNIKLLNGKPLICYSIDLARILTDDENICVSTDDRGIVKIVENYGLPVPFIRPSELATDESGSEDVILHAIRYYERMGRHYDAVVLLQPTSPFRRSLDVIECIKTFSKSNDMVVSVTVASSNPYYNCFELNSSGYLSISKGEGNVIRRQNAPDVYEYNGAVYVINIESLKKMHMHDFKKVGMFLMDRLHSLDLDTDLDWSFAEFLIKEKLV